MAATTGPRGPRERGARWLASPARLTAVAALASGFVIGCLAGFVVAPVAGVVVALAAAALAVAGVCAAAGRRRRASDTSEAQELARRFEAIIEQTDELVGLADGAGRTLYLNGAARRLLDLADDVDLATLDVADLYTDDSLRVLLTEALPAVARGDVWNGELALRDQSGLRPIPTASVLLGSRSPEGELDFVAGIARDMTDRKGLEAELARQADLDQLTGLPNRQPLMEVLGDALRGIDGSRSSVALLFFDIDRFKIVNDSLGHQAGDQVLVAMARRLVRAVRPHDRVARFGGDEFVAVCTDVDGPDEAVEIADRVRREVGGRFSLGDGDVHVTVSIGVALASVHDEPEHLLRDADAAMHEAKSLGRDRVEVFDASVRSRVVDRLDTEQALRRAIGRAELRLHYQPLVDLVTGRVRGVEALVRWEHPERGLLLPCDFLRVAEETGLIIEMGRWILGESLTTAREVFVDPAAGEPLPLFVNLSARQLAHIDLVPMVSEVIDLTGVDPHVVHFEITEDALMVDVEATTATLAALRDLGVHLALDDFGTGHSSLAYLKQFPVEVLKIDRTFVGGLGNDDGDDAITGAILNVAQLLGITTVAEGVERADQAEILARMGCEIAQGFHFARPMESELLTALLCSETTAD